MQVVPITTNVVSSNPARGEVYSIKHAAIMWFSPVSSTNKSDRFDITEILLRVELNTPTPAITDIFMFV